MPHRGRGGSYPPAPRTNPGVRNYRTGLFRKTRFRKALSQTKRKSTSNSFGAFDDMGFHDAEEVQKLLEPYPIIALALAAVVENPVQVPDDTVVKLVQTWRVAMHTKVIVVTAQFCVERFEQIG